MIAPARTARHRPAMAIPGECSPGAAAAARPQASSVAPRAALAGVTGVADLHHRRAHRGVHFVTRRPVIAQPVHHEQTHERTGEHEQPRGRSATAAASGAGRECESSRSSLGGPVWVLAPP